VFLIKGGEHVHIEILDTPVEPASAILKGT
jgi:hypothetical protein